jgi:hypothetical protein
MARSGQAIVVLPFMLYVHLFADPPHRNAQSHQSSSCDRV